MVTVCPWWSVCPHEDPFPRRTGCANAALSKRALFFDWFYSRLCSVFAAPGALRHHVTLRLKGGAVIGLFQFWRLYSPFSAAQEVEVNREFTATGYKAGGSLLT